MSLADDLQAAFLTSELTDGQRAQLIEAGEELEFGPDVELFVEGHPASHLWILLSGEIQLSRRVAHQPMVLATMTRPGQWAGGFAAWGADDEAAVYRTTGRALTAGRCLAVPSADLSRLVGEWSPFAKHMVIGVFQTVRRIDATARQRESLIALGTLAAGLAHEINNPASASLRAVDALRNTGDFMISSLVTLAEQGIVAEQFLDLDRLRVELQDRPVTQDSAIARADREELVGAWMEVRRIAAAWQIAPVLATLGVDEAWLDELESVIGAAALEPALRWISSTIGSRALLGELADATSRIAHLVEDVKTYSQMDRAEVQRLDIRLGIESTLSMLAPKLSGVEVERRYDADLPEVEVFAAELNQVWTNLIDNAIDAMGGHGRLEIATHREGDHVVVEITDSGPGIDPSVRDRIFEPFFTTKDVGKGTGLGLDISRRIVVDRHGGEISFDSAPGSTTARVQLPISA
jgi:signal transduction histidine kinase